MLSQHLQQLRIEKGFSPEVVATKLNVSRQTIYSWESGEAKPPVEQIRKLAILYGCTTDHILAFDNEKRSLIEISGITDEQNAHIQMIAEDYRKQAAH